MGIISKQFSFKLNVTYFQGHELQHFCVTQAFDYILKGWYQNFVNSNKLWPHDEMGH